MAAESPGSLKARLKNDVNTALRAGEKERLSVLRMAMAAIQQREVDGRLTLADDGVQAVLEKMVKQRREAIEQFRSGGREELAAKESAEIEVLKEYLPEPMGPEEAERLMEEVIRSLGASAPKDMGRVMAEIKSRASGRVDLAELAKRVRAHLSGV